MFFVFLGWEVATLTANGDKRGEGRVDLSRQTPSIPLLRGRNGGQTWPRQGQMVTKDGRDGDKRRVRMAEEGTKGTRAGVAGKDG